MTAPRIATTAAFIGMCAAAIPPATTTGMRVRIRTTVRIFMPILSFERPETPLAVSSCEPPLDERGRVFERRANALFFAVHDHRRIVPDTVAQRLDAAFHRCRVDNAKPQPRPVCIDHPTHPVRELLILALQVFREGSVQLLAAVPGPGPALPPDQLAMHAVKERHRGVGNYFNGDGVPRRPRRVAGQGPMGLECRGQPHGLTTTMCPPPSVVKHYRHAQGH